MDAKSTTQHDKALDTLFAISKILDTGLDQETLKILAGLCEAGVNPEALALIVKELRREAENLQAAAAPGSEAAQQ